MNEAAQDLLARFRVGARRFGCHEIDTRWNHPHEFHSGSDSDSASQSGIRRSWIKRKKSSFRILVIDDSPTVIRAIEDAFAQTPCFIDTVEHFLEIPRFLRLTPPDLIILDLNMPGLSGERVSEFIRRVQQRDTPILIYSSLPASALQAASERISARGWVSKQAPLHELVAFVYETLV